MLIFNIPISKIFARDLDAFRGKIPKGLEGVINERNKFEQLLLKQKLNPRSLTSDERLELEKLQREYKKLNADVNDDKPFTDY